MSETASAMMRIVSGWGVVHHSLTMCTENALFISQSEFFLSTASLNAKLYCQN